MNITTVILNATPRSFGRPPAVGLPQDDKSPVMPSKPSVILRRKPKNLGVILVVFVVLGGIFFHLSGKSLATWYDDPIELLLALVLYVHASQERVYGAGNYLYREKITIGNTGAADSKI